jgi:FixJ family two-component response regulator
VRSALAALLRARGFVVESWESGEGLLDALPLLDRGVILLDLRMPGRDGLDVLDALRSCGIDFPVILLTGHGDIPMSVQAVKNGAFDFLTKPVSGDDLLKTVAAALLTEEMASEAGGRRRELLRREAVLTPTEREVFRRVVAGQPNKMIAAELGCAERTVKAHRSQVMHKMAATSLPELVIMAAEIV